MAPSLSVLASTLLLTLSAAQKPGATPDNHPPLKTWKCTVADGCTAQDTSVVLDSLAHWVHQKEDQTKGCGNWGSGPDPSICPDIETCHENCVMEGNTDYSQNGIVTDGGKLTLNQIMEDGRVVSPRIYLLAEGGEKYEMLQLTGQEFTFDVDVSKLPCGMNGALYLSEMEEDGGVSKNALSGGAPWGTGYCDAQCFTTPFINGVANIDAKGSCCNELDIWEANSRSTHLAPHPCNQTGLYLCEGDECAFDGVCDKNGCGFNPYRVGHDDYYGTGMKVDTSKPFTVVTQFPANDDGELTEIHRLYIQDGKIIQNAKVEVDGPPKIDFVNDAFCEATGSRRYMDLGATAAMGSAMTRGMVLAFSIWWDEGGYMTWLDGAEAGPCSVVKGQEEGNPTHIVQVEPHPVVSFSNIKWGEIGSTYSSTACKSKAKAKAKAKAKKH